MENVIEKAKALLDAIDKNHEQLWNNALSETHGCIIWTEDVIPNGDCDNDNDDDISVYSGIMNEFIALKKAIKESGQESDLSWDGHCPECEEDDLEQIEGGTSEMTMVCNACCHQFQIEADGWRVV